MKCRGLNANHAVLNASINFFDIFFGEINAKYAISDLPRASGKVPSHFWGVLNAAINAADLAGNLPKAVFRADSAGLDVLNPAVSVYSVVRNSTAAVNDAGQGNQRGDNFARIAYYAAGCFAGISFNLTSGFSE